jgi:hypothetical protein
MSVPMIRKLLRLRNFSLLLLTFIVFIHCHAQDTSRQDIIAKIGDKYSINFAELQNFVHDNFFNRLYQKNVAEGYKKALEILIIKRSILFDFFDRGLDEKKELFQNIRRTINEELAIKYFTTYFHEEYINNQSLQKAYRETGKEVVYQHILLPRPKDYSSNDKDSLHVLANEIKTKLDKGTNFNEIRKTYSSVIIPSNLNNRILTMDWKTSLLSAMNNAIFNIPVGKSRILENYDGCFIVKVVKIKMNKVSPFENVKDEIHSSLEKKFSLLGFQEFNSFKNNLVDEKTVKWNQRSIKQLLVWSNIPGFYQKYYKDTIQYAISQDRNFLILTHSKGKVDLKEFLRLLDEVLTTGDRRLIKEDQLKAFILEAVRSNYIVNRAIKLNLEKEIVHPRTMNSAIRDELINLYVHYVIESQVPPATQSALQQFYNENKDSLFYQLAKVNIYAIIDSNKNTMDELKLRLNQNVKFEKLRNELIVKTYIKDREGIIKSYYSPEPPFLGKAAFELKPDEIAGPIEYNNPVIGKQYALIKCIARQEEKQLTYNDVERTIAETYKKYYKNEMTKRVEEQLKKKYPITIYKDVLKQNLSSLGIKSEE